MCSGSLAGLKPFEGIQKKLIENLQPKNGFGLKDFKKVHSGCEIMEIGTGESLRVGGIDIDIGKWSDVVQIKKLHCVKHKVVSVEFFNYSGYIKEGPF